MDELEKQEAFLTFAEQLAGKEITGFRSFLKAEVKLALETMIAEIEKADGKDLAEYLLNLKEQLLVKQADVQDGGVILDGIPIEDLLVGAVLYYLNY